MTAISQSGQCFCGQVCYQIKSNIADAFYCHCESCRRHAGAPFVAWARINAEQFKIVNGKLTEFNDHPRVSRGFCNRCGTGISYRHEDSYPDLDFLIATLDSPTLAPTYHIRVKEKLPWISINDGLPQYQAWRDVNSET